MNIRKTINRLSCYVGLHAWNVEHDTGVWSYQECELCGKRRVRRKLVYGYQPVNTEWVNGGKWYEIQDKFTEPSEKIEDN